MRRCQHGMWTTFACALSPPHYDVRMPDLYEQLLEATIEHLKDLQARGQKFVVVPPPNQAPLISRAELHGSRVASAARVKTPLRTSSGVAIPDLPPGPQPRPETPLILSPANVPISSEAKLAAFAELRERALVCQKCPHLAASRKNVVFGVGDINSPLMFVGEAPGADEDEQAEPFVGKAGQLLTRMIQTMGFTRETVYIANILKCRPDTPGQAYGNRKPTAEEMKTCLPYLLAQIDLIQPKVMVALGATAVQGLFGSAAGITRLRGQFQTFRNIPVMPTYHPAYLLRNQSMAEKRKVWEDLLQVMEKLALPISEKQRNYFLKA